MGCYTDDALRIVGDRTYHPPSEELQYAFTESHYTLSIRLTLGKSEFEYMFHLRLAFLGGGHIRHGGIHLLEDLLNTRVEMLSELGIGSLGAIIYSFLEL